MRAAFISLTCVHPTTRSPAEQAKAKAEAEKASADDAANANANANVDVDDAKKTDASAVAAPLYKWDGGRSSGYECAQLRRRRVWGCNYEWTRLGLGAFLGGGGVRATNRRMVDGDGMMGWTRFGAFFALWHCSAGVGVAL
eukprot:855741-Prorocentrum_minimum.AAC.1